eukprot:Polyplicarium_translucidae@DN1897_c0_g1_i1.p1
MLQLPDSLLSRGPEIAQSLAGRCGAPDPHPPRFCVLADTRLGDCCPDVIAGAHHGGDCIIQFGVSCGAPSRSPMPVLVAPPAHEHFGPGIDKVAPLIADATIERSILLVFEEDDEFVFGSLVGAIVRASDETDRRFLVTRQGRAEAGQLTALGRPVYELLAGGTDLLPVETLPGDVAIVCITTSNEAPGPLTSCALLEFGNSYPVHEAALSADGGEFWDRSPHAARALAKRHASLTAAADAKAVGIVTVSPALEGQREWLLRMRTLMRSRRIRHHSIVMGKLNAEKLCNFPSLDAFIIIGCPLQTARIFERARSFPRPVISPREAEIAWGVREWQATIPLWLSGALDGPPIGGPDPLSDDDEVGGVLARGLEARLTPLAARTFRGVEPRTAAPAADIEPGTRGTSALYDTEPRLG